jgi:glutamate-1-semialdehyde 2,1-aminomutase
MLAVLPFFHVYGLHVILNFALQAGATVVAMPRFELRQFLQAIERYRVTRGYVVPAIAQALAGDDVAALILEPTGASWGAIPLPEELLREIRELTRAHDTLLVFDEVVTGFRFAPGGVQERTGVVPDLTSLAKILAGGLPGGALTGRADVMDVLAFREPDAIKVAHPGTHNAHPLSAAAGVATLSLLGDGAVHARADALAASLRDGLNDVLRRHGAPGFAHGKSSTFILVLGVEGPVESLPPELLKRPIGGELSAALHCGMLLEGVHLFHSAGFVSAVHSEEDVARTVDAFDAVVPRLQAEGLLA